MIARAFCFAFLWLTQAQHVAIGASATATEEITDCDRYAASPLDVTRPDTVAGVPASNVDHTLAVPACVLALAKGPVTARLRFQLGRAVEKAGRIGAAVTQYELAAEAGHIGAMHNLANIKLDGGDGTAPDKQRAFKLYQTAAAGGLAVSKRALGLMLRDGNGVAKDIPQALRWFDEAIRLGQVDAHYLAADALLDPAAPGGPDFEKAASHWRALVKAGDADGGYRLALALRDGKVQKRSDREIIQAFELAVSVGGFRRLADFADVLQAGKALPADPAAALAIAYRGYDSSFGASPDQDDSWIMNQQWMAQLIVKLIDNHGLKPRDPTEIAKWRRDLAPASMKSATLPFVCAGKDTPIELHFWDWSRDYPNTDLQIDYYEKRGCTAGQTSDGSNVREWFRKVFSAASASKVSFMALATELMTPSKGGQPTPDAPPAEAPNTGEQKTSNLAEASIPAHAVDIERDLQNQPMMIGLSFNLQRTKFQDMRVRRALTMAFNFSRINVDGDLGQPVRMDSLLKGTRAYSAEPPDAREIAILQGLRSPIPVEALTARFSHPFASDLQEATRLLEAAGYKAQDGVLKEVKSGLPLEIELLTMNGDAEGFLDLYINDLKRLGIGATIILVHSSQVNDRVQSANFDMAVLENPKLDNESRYRYGSSPVRSCKPDMFVWDCSYLGVKDPAIDELLAATMNAKTAQEYGAALRALDQILLWNHYFIPLWIVSKAGTNDVASEVARECRWWKVSMSQTQSRLITQLSFERGSSFDPDFRFTDRNLTYENTSELTERHNMRYVTPNFEFSNLTPGSVVVTLKYLPSFAAGGRVFSSHKLRPYRLQFQIDQTVIAVLENQTSLSDFAVGMRVDQLKHLIAEIKRTDTGRFGMWVGTGSYFGNHFPFGFYVPAREFVDCAAAAIDAGSSTP